MANRRSDYVVTIIRLFCLCSATQCSTTDKLVHNHRCYQPSCIIPHRPLSGPHKHSKSSVKSQNNNDEFLIILPLRRSKRGDVRLPMMSKSKGCSVRCDSKLESPSHLVQIYCNSFVIVNTKLYSRVVLACHIYSILPRYFERCRNLLRSCCICCTCSFC